MSHILCVTPLAECTVSVCLNVYFKMFIHFAYILSVSFVRTQRHREEANVCKYSVNDIKERERESLDF